MKKKCVNLHCYVSRRPVETEKEHCLVCGLPLIPDLNTVGELLDFLNGYKENK